MLTLQKNKHNIISFLAVFTILTTSGAGIINTIWSLCLITLLLLCINSTLRRNVFYWVLMWVIVLFVNTVLGGGGAIVQQELYIMVLRIGCVAVIVSQIPFDEFLEYFVKIMCFLAILSLIYYVGLIITPNIFESFAFVSGNVQGTIFQVHGFATETNFTRNCGIFWEPGVYQIYLNFAIMLLMFEVVPVDRYRLRKIILLSIALLTTQSSMGLLCFAITLFSASLFIKNSINKTSLRIIAFFMIIILVIVEYRYSIIGYKLLDGGGSFASRLEDIRISLSVMKSYPIFGTGLLREFGTIWEAHRVALEANFWGELANSNGLGACLFKMGVPFTIIHLGLLFMSYYKMTGRKILISIVFMINTLLFFANEPIVFVPFWIMMASGVQDMSRQYIES